MAMNVRQDAELTKPGYLTSQEIADFRKTIRKDYEYFDKAFADIKPLK
jgi:hypothetical protein